MRRFRLWLLVILSALLATAWGCRATLSPSPLAISQTIPAGVNEELVVEGDRLLAHVEALAFPRFDDEDRDRTRRYLQQELERDGWQVTDQPFTEGINIVATRPDTDPEAEIVILAAHYDTVFQSPGADDNATGVATLLEAAHLFAPLETARTLQLVFFDQEEAGLLGSTAFAATVTPSPASVAIVLDMVGYACDEPGCQTYPSGLPIEPPSDRGNFLAAIGDQPHNFLLSAFQSQIGDTLPPVFTLAVPQLGALTPDLLRSDHAPFWEEGIGAILVTDTANFRNPHYHQPSDTPDTLDPIFFRGSAQIILNATYQLLHGE
ncbi:M28 family peptidase [Vacuolonema iberomarrocanum]|uniref:M28 family peptidase n=1 Tax=Vacuolonema iberomarrocanum TaxID=3454632 RepID=UPI001A045CC7|nr:M28 family peptidase [filamentous cyanobacterium LEGE 07170]